MTPLKCWAKFNAVGLLGAVLQLSTLALLNRCFPRHYLTTSAAAVELTLLHNFLWHLHYTWRDRRDGTKWLRQCLRFHLSNGLVSLLGSLALIRWLVATTHLPLAVDNALSIACCSVVNFVLGHRWAFARAPETAAASRKPKPSFPQLC